MHITPLTNAEEQLMQLFWKLDSFYLKQVMEQHPEPKPHQNTISTYLKILVEKQFLKTEKEGRIFCYTVAIPQEKYRNFVLKNLIDHFFEGNSSSLVKALVTENLLKSSDLADFFEVKTVVVPVKKEEKKIENPIAEFINEITSSKKDKKKKDKKKDKKKRK